MPSHVSLKILQKIFFYFLFVIFFFNTSNAQERNVVVEAGLSVQTIFLLMAMLTLDGLP